MNPVTNGAVWHTTDLFEAGHTRGWAWMHGTEYPWEILPMIGDMIRSIGAELPTDAYGHPSEDVWIAHTARIDQTAVITGPAIIGENTEVRHNAFLRGNTLVGDGCVVGNSSELKNCILFDGARVPHFNYVGDSVLGYKTHLGAGAVTSNVKGDYAPVAVRTPEGEIATGLKKVGAMVGDGVEVGCNSVLNPGSVVGPYARIYPLTSARGVIPPHCIVKSATGGETVEMA